MTDTTYIGDQGSTGNIYVFKVFLDCTVEYYVYPGTPLSHDGPNRCQHCTPAIRFDNGGLEYVKWIIPKAIVLGCGECCETYCLECFLSSIDR